jgi:hypothetical protein
MTGLTAIAKLAVLWVDRAENINGNYAISDKPLSEQEWVEKCEMYGGPSPGARKVAVNTPRRSLKTQRWPPPAVTTAKPDRSRCRCTSSVLRGCLTEKIAGKNRRTLSHERFASDRGEFSPNGS